jgi:RNAse (barnase) inhibitor barstar
MENRKADFKKLRDEKIDIGILAKGGISLYYNTTVINYDIELLFKKGYAIIEFDGELITDDNELHFYLQEKLQLPNYSGESFDALDDCLIDYEVPQSGVVLVFRKLDYLNTRSVYHLLDLFAKYSRKNLAIGRNLIILTQVENPTFTIKEPIGSLNFWLWNDQEWFEATRR